MNHLTRTIVGLVFVFGLMGFAASYFYNGLKWEGGWTMVAVFIVMMCWEWSKGDGGKK